MEKHFNVYFVRHGETLFNIKRICQGVADSPLTKAGIEQAKVLGKAWENKHFDKYFISNLGRVEETFQNIRPNTEYIRTPLLHEVDLGTLEGEHYGVIDWAHISDGFGDFAGESKEKILQRVHELFDYLVEKSDDGDEIMCVTHGMFIGWVVSVFLNKSYNDTVQQIHHIENCSITKLIYDGQFHLQEVNSLDYDQFL